MNGKQTARHNILAFVFNQGQKDRKQASLFEIKKKKYVNYVDDKDK